MLSTTYSTFWPMLSLAMGGFCIGLVVFTVRYVRRLTRYCADATDFLHSNNLDALKDSKIGDLERSLTELWDSHTSLLASHKRLRSKYSMRDLRERRKGGDDDPNGELDLSTTTDKRALRLELRKKGLLK